MAWQPPITPGKPVRRETAALYRGNPLIIELHPSYLTFREKGRRNGVVTVDYRAALDLGFKMLERAARAERLTERKEKRKR